MKELKFEEALTRLEKIVDMLEDNTTPLDDSLKLFEEGNNLVKLCLQKLNTVENKLKSLTQENKSGYSLND